MTFHTFLASVSAQLVSFYKPLLLFATFLPWAWLISSKLDKDARYFHLNLLMWNAIHLACGLAALAGMLLIPIFWLGWPVGIVILGAPIYAYWQIRNREVPESQQYTLTGKGLLASLETRKQARATRGAMLRFKDAQGNDRAVPTKEDPLYAIHLLVEDLIAPALAARATQIEFAAGPGGGTASQIIDGIRYKRESTPPESAVGMIAYLKDLAGLDVEDRRRRQAATFLMFGPSGEIQLSLTTAGSSNGQMMKLVFDRSKRLLKPFDDLGLLPSQIEALRVLEQPHERHGIVLIGAPTGQGLSTSSYSLPARHDAYTSNIKTLEHEVLTRIDGVDHVQWDPNNPDVDYATNLQSILRRDPDVVLITEISDHNTAHTVAEPGLKGPLIYIPQRSSTITDQIREWVKIVKDLKMAIRPLRAVTNQRLLRTLCPNCRQSYQPAREQLQKLNVPSNKIGQLYRASGKVQVKNKIENCPVCGGTGYLGQTGAFEVMIIDDEARRLLLAGDLKGALAHARRHKMVYLQEAALSKAVNGDTSIEEVLRVTTPVSTSAPTAPRPKVDPAAAT